MEANYLDLDLFLLFYREKRIDYLLMQLSSFNATIIVCLENRLQSDGLK